MYITFSSFYVVFKKHLNNISVIILFMSTTWTSIKIRNSTKLKIKTEVTNMFLHYHPEFKGMDLSYDFVVTKMTDFYLTG